MQPAPSNLAELVAPLSEPEFLSLLRARKLALSRGADPDRYKKFMSWERLLGMIERGEHPRSLVEFKLTRGSVMVPPDRWLVRDPVGNSNKVDVAKVLKFLDEGFSLVIAPIEPYVPALTALCDSIRLRLNEQIKVGVIVTQGREGAFKLHYDPEDLIILQVEGQKRWRIFGPPVVNPVVGMPHRDPPPEDVPIFDDLLGAGDMLFVPGGNWHRCETGPGRSLHLGIFFTPPTGWHAVKMLTQRLLSDDVFLKPITRVDDPAELAMLEADVKNRIREAIDGLALDRFAADWTRARGS